MAILDDVSRGLIGATTGYVTGGIPGLLAGGVGSGLLGAGKGGLNLQSGLGSALLGGGIGGAAGALKKGAGKLLTRLKGKPGALTPGPVSGGLGRGSLDLDLPSSGFGTPTIPGSPGTVLSGGGYSELPSISSPGILDKILGFQEKR